MMREREKAQALYHEAAIEADDRDGYRADDPRGALVRSTPDASYYGDRHREHEGHAYQDDDDPLGLREAIETEPKVFARKAATLYEPSEKTREWQEKTKAEERFFSEREKAELRHKFGSGTAVFHDGGEFRREHLANAYRTDDAEREGRRRQGLLFNHRTPDEPADVALPQKSGHSEDPLENRQFRGSKRDREGRLYSTGDGKNSAGHSETYMQHRLFRRKHAADGGFESVGGEQYNGHSEDELATRRSGGEERASKKKRIAMYW